MTSGELEVIVLVPMLEREILESCSIRKFQVGKMPVQYSPVPSTQIHVTKEEIVQKNSYCENILQYCFSPGKAKPILSP